MAAEATMAAGVVGTAGAVCTAMAGDAVVTAGTAERRWASWSARSDLRMERTSTHSTVTWSALKSVRRWAS